MMFSSSQPDFLIVGSGAGGAVLAKELASAGRRVWVLERGFRPQGLGGIPAGWRHYELPWLALRPPLSGGGVIVWRAIGAGGSTSFALGNGVPCLVNELRERGIDIATAVAEIEKELGIKPVPEERIGPRARLIREAADELGYPLGPMPKMTAFTRCLCCGRCMFGCAQKARWSGLEALHEASQKGARLEYGVRVTELLVERGGCSGVRARIRGEETTFKAGCVILSAGALGTPVLLQQAGIPEAGKQLFVDAFQNTYGWLPHRRLPPEMPMSLLGTHFQTSDRLILSPYVPASRLALYYELGMKGFMTAPGRLIGIMAKIADDLTGEVRSDGQVTKILTPSDWARLRKGNEIAIHILEKAGIPRSSLFTSRIQGSHPGGTAAIGTVVDRQLQTRLENLYVCDASVLPCAPGCPPIVTIAALAKRLAKHLTRG